MRNKPSLAVLCDVSGSVSLYSAFLLQLVYAMNRRFRDIRSFLYLFLDTFVGGGLVLNSLLALWLFERDDQDQVVAAIISACRLPSRPGR